MTALQRLDQFNRRVPTRPVQLVGWLGFTALAVLTISSLARNATPVGTPWQESNGVLLDYRDIVVVPGRWILQGRNPYDPVPYLGAHPWAQEFDPYAPSWLLISVALGWLPVALGGAIYTTVGTLLNAMVAVRLTKVAVPASWAWIAPFVAIWFSLWYPTRTLGSSFLLSVALVFLATSPHRCRERPWSSALLLSIVLIKPQIGMPISLYLLFARQGGLVLRGWLLMVLASLPAGIVCLLDAGGLPEFWAGLMRDIEYARSPAAATGLLAHNSYRIDLPGMLARSTEHAPSSLTMLALTAMVAMPICLVMLRHGAGALAVPLVVAGTLLVPLHFNYDLTFWPLAAAMCLAYARRRPTRLSIALAVVALLPVAHLHRLSTALGFSRVGGDWIDVALLVAAIVLAMSLTLSRPDAVHEAPAEKERAQMS